MNNQQAINNQHNFKIQFTCLNGSSEGTFSIGVDESSIKFGNDKALTSASINSGTSSTSIGI